MFTMDVGTWVRNIYGMENVSVLKKYMIPTVLGTNIAGTTRTGYEMIVLAKCVHNKDSPEVCVSFDYNNIFYHNILPTSDNCSFYFVVAACHHN